MPSALSTGYGRNGHLTRRPSKGSCPSYGHAVTVNLVLDSVQLRVLSTHIPTDQNIPLVLSPALVRVRVSFGLSMISNPPDFGACVRR